MSMETDLRAKHNQAKLKNLCDWGPVRTPQEDIPSINLRELKEQVDAMAGPQVDGGFTPDIQAAFMGLHKKLDNHRECLLLMATGLKDMEERLRLHKVPKKHTKKKQNGKRKRAA